MGATTKNLILINNLAPHQVLDVFFHSHTTEAARDALWYLFKAWVNSPPAGRMQYSDEEIALFLDQLIDLVAAAYSLHQANRVSNKPGEGRRHD